MKKIIIAIDGHSSTGKSTAAKAIAKKLGYIYVDTGAMYRSVTLYCMQNGIIKNEQTDTEALKKALPQIKIEFDSQNKTLLNGVNVEDKIRTIDVAENVSAISAIEEVRTAMVKLQQAMGQSKGIVMDGRDIGTVVFPNAEMKIFMTADPEVRARRRYDELVAKGYETNFNEVKKNIEDRDYADTTRKISPLKKADDAIVLDNGNMTPDQQLTWLVNKANEVINGN